MGDRLLGRSAVSSDSYSESPLHQSSFSQSAHPISAQQTSFDPLRSINSSSSQSNYNDQTDYGFSAQSPSGSQSYNNTNYSFSNPSTTQSNYSSSQSNNQSNYSSNQSATYTNGKSSNYSNGQSTYQAPNQAASQANSAFYHASPVTVGSAGAAPVYGYSAPQSFVPQQLNQIGYGSSDLVRITRVPTPFAYNKHAMWPGEYPLFTNSSIGYYVSNSEWNRTIASINQAFTWSKFELALHYSLLAGIVLLFVLYYLFLMASSGQSLTLVMIRWAAIIVVSAAYAYGLRWSRLRVLNRMLVQVQYESRQYSQANNPSRPGKLPCSWHVDGDQLVVTALGSANGSSNQQSSWR